MTEKIQVAYVVRHPACPSCLALAEKVIQALLKAHHKGARVLQDRVADHYAIAIAPAGVEEYERHDRRDPWKAAAPLSVEAQIEDRLGVLVHRLECMAGGIEDRARVAMADGQYDEMRELESEARGFRRAALVVNEDRRNVL